jgi:hypothetical protein
MATLSKTVLVRLATADDLPAVHSLIRDSFAALGDHYSPEATMVYSSAAESAIARYTFRSVDYIDWHFFLRSHRLQRVLALPLARQ